jgi:hypothetical protein
MVRDRGEGSKGVCTMGNEIFRCISMVVRCKILHSLE